MLMLLCEGTLAGAHTLLNNWGSLTILLAVSQGQ